MPTAKEVSPHFFMWSGRFLRRFPSLLVVLGIGIVIVLFCQSIIPLRVEHLLEEGEWHTEPIVALAVLIIIQLAVNYLVILRADRLAIATARKIREEMYDSALVENSDELSRTEIAIRHTGDVDNVQVAVEKSLAEGIPGVLRIILSLILLSFISLPAGIVMILATAVFLALRFVISRRLFQLDQVRLTELSMVATSVDEAIISARPLNGLELINWAKDRFDARLIALSNTAHHVGVLAARMHTAAHTAGLLGLFVVVVVAVGPSAENVGVIAASLLYIEGVVRGLESLPGWIRSVQLAGASIARIQQILDWKATDALIDANMKSLTPETIPPGVTGVVVPTSIDVEIVLESMARTLGEHSLFVPANPLTLDVSVEDLAAGSGLKCSVESFQEICEKVGLDFGDPLDQASISIKTSLSMLTVNDRQRLAIAIAIGQEPKALLLGPLLALSDPDSDLHLGELAAQFNIPRVLFALKVSEQVPWTESIVFHSQAGPLIGEHQTLLIEQPQYAEIWERRLNASEVDLSVLGLEGESAFALQARLVTEKYEAGDYIYRGGELADRIVFLISGRIEVNVNDTDGDAHRVAVIGPGAHCGDLRLTVGERRTESAIALENCVVRTLSREAIAVGVTGLLDRSPVERKIVAALLRNGPSSEIELIPLLPGISPEQIKKAFALLLSDGAIAEENGKYRVQQKRAIKSGTESLFDLLG
ncbi:MAG: cyclic nucleotide-binding domain-containing protein [Actinomycetia bacterium]|jgi:CRP-like cAMP-binding protein/ABC-type multidrug transport system fused ATPase/permease subunit|nr:cyclic nucleotide-binding domain-containing protein [Actinomycetes bacterium]MCH9841187.1 cyclic nucleotide-binding domain-containing protein [Actinomycetes bacterium]